MSRELFKLLLTENFYSNNKHRIKKELFPEDVHPLIEIIIDLHTASPKDYTLTDVWLTFKSNNPVATAAQLEKYYGIINAIKKEEDVSPEVGEQVLRSAWRNHVLTQAAEEIFQLTENRNDDWSKVKTLISQAEEGYVKKEDETYIEPDLSQLLDLEENNFKWKWNYEPLHEQLGGLGPALFTILAARPDCGKTLAWVHFVFGPGGFLEQGAKVHVLCNEEPAIRTFLRGVCSKVGYPITYIRENRERFQEDVTELKGKIFVKDISDFSINDLEKYCEGKDIDILIIDQLDKMVTNKEGTSGADALQRLYEKVRSIGKKYQLAPIAVTQASAGAQNKLYYGYDFLNNSKTGKAGEGDFILCIGMEEVTENRPDKGFRMFNIAKNKSPTGSKNPVACYFNRSLSRIGMDSEYEYKPSNTVVPFTPTKKD